MLINEITKSSKKDKMSAIFIDLTSAFNTINRLLLYQILRDKSIYKEEEI